MKESSESVLRVASVLDDCITDGDGLRFVLFLQGCFHNCPGCQNPQTHDPDGGFEMTAEEILKKIKANPLLDGVTFSGGDPFIQADKLAVLAEKIHQYGLNVWTYTGYTWEELTGAGNADWDALLRQTDVLVDGRYLAEKRDLSLLFRGSSNQRIIDVERSLEKGEVVLHPKP